MNEPWVPKSQIAKHPAFGKDLAKMSHMDCMNLLVRNLHKPSSVAMAREILEFKQQQIIICQSVKALADAQRAMEESRRRFAACGSVD